MHTNRASPCVLSDIGVAFGIKGAAIFRGEPLMTAEQIVIVGVNDCKFAFSQGYSAKGIAEAHAAIQQEHEDQSLFQPARDFDNELDNSLPQRIENTKHSTRHLVVEIRNSKQCQNSNFKCSKQRADSSAAPSALRLPLRRSLP